MPQAPTVPGLVPTAVPSGYLPNVDLPVPVDAFGGAVGHALQGFGQDIQQSSDRIWQRAIEMQGLQNETEAKEADAKYMMESGKLHADFINKEGLNAGPEALAKHIQDLQDLRTNIRGSLSNPMAQKMYDASSLSFMGRNIFNAAGHSGQQMKVASNNAADARIDQAKANIGDNPDDNLGFQTNIRAIRAENARKAVNGGWTKEQYDATTEKDVSEAVAHRIVGIGRTNAIGAQKMFDEATKAGVLRAQEAEKVQATVQTQFRDQGSRYISDKVLNDRREGDEDDQPVQTYIDRAMEEADKIGSQDPLFKDFVRNRVVADYNRQRAIETDTNNQNLTTIGKALMKANSEGFLPSTVEQLKAIDPAVGPAWDSLSRDPRKQQAILKQLAANARGDKVPITADNLQDFHRWRGQAMAGSDEERAAFMAQDFATNQKLALSQRNSLMSLQDQMRKQSQEDPRVARAVRMLKPNMIAAGIDPRGGDDARHDYYSFIGALQDQLDQYGKDHPGKVPTMEEVRTMGAQLMQEQITSKGFFWDDKEPMYKLTVPEEDAKRLREDPYWKSRGIIPNESMIGRIYRAQQFREKFGGSAKKPAEAQFPPNAPEGK